MPVGKDLSIVADSTVSSSPPLDVDATLQVKRATRTYGRRREEPQVEEISSTATNMQEPPGILSVHNTAPPGLRDEIPPSSPRTHLADSDVGGRDNDIETSSFGKPTFNFAWRDELKKLDESDDEDAEMPTVMKLDDASSASGFGLPLLLQPADSEKVPSTPSDRKPLTSKALLVEDVFQDGPSAGRMASPSGMADLSSPTSSPTPAIPGRARKTRRNVIAGSDSEQEQPKDCSSTTASASSSKHKSRSSSTPPTSEDDVPANIIPKSRSAGKKKDAVIPRARVPPLQFTEDVTELRKSNGGGKKKKTKAPTMKEQEEMVKERSRIMVQTAVSIPRAEVPKYSLDSLFEKISAKQAKPTTLTSDPILQFSSPTKETELTPAQDVVPPVPPRPRTMIIRRSLSPENNDSGDESDLPEIGQVLTAGIKKGAKQKELLELKKRVLQQRSAAVRDEYDEEDDELEIVQSNPKLVVKEEQEHRRAIHKRPSEGRKRQMQLAQINPSKQASKAESAFSPVRKAQGHHGSLSIFQQVDIKDFSQKKLNLLLAAEAQKKAQLEKEKKVAEWQKHGGRIVNHGDVQAQGLSAAIQNVAERGLKAAESRAAGHVDLDDEEDTDDADWDPAERGSASPEPVDAEEKVGSDDADEEEEEEENDENMPLDVGMADTSDALDEEGTKVRQSRRMVLSDSEEENDENAPITSKESYRRSTSSCDVGTEEEEDKENNTKFMYDRGEDKENTAVVRHGALEGPSPGDDTPTPPVSPRRRRSGTWGARDWEREDEDENTPNQRRRPLKDLISEESPILSTMLPTNLTQSFTAKLQQSSPLAGTLAPAPVLKPLFDNDDSTMDISGGFSQFSQADGEPFGAAPALQPGFSDLFESTTQKEGKSKEVSLEGERIGNLKRSDTLGLTQDFSALKDLQPPFQGSDNLIRKADAIFEKEQAFILEDATRKPQQKPELYVNDHGFLTQTRPTDGSPEIYRPSPSQHGLYNSRQNHLLSAMQSGSRTPLRTLSMTSLPDSPTQKSPPRRLQRYDRTPPRRPARELPESPVLAEPSGRVINAFDVLANGAQKLKQRRQDELKNRPDLAAFLEDEAAESDDEDAFGFAKPKTAEDDENEEDLDATLHELMDDKEMDQDTIASELVHAKFMEQLEVDDQEIEKFHQGVIQGEQRMKRRRGVEVDDSEEDSEMEEENERARRAMKKLRKSDRHDIKTLENDESTRAFAESYNMTLKDDDAEFLYLDKEGSGMPNDQMLVDGEGSDVEEDEDNEPETVTHDEISRRVRQMQEEGIEDTGMDPQDVSWVDEEDEDEEAPRVKTINTRVRSRGRAQVALEPSDMDGMGAAFRKPTNMTTHSSKQWYAQEQKTRNAGTSRSVGGSAITGHAKAKSKTGNGTVRAGSMMKRSNTASSSGTSGSSNGSRPVRPAPSVLAVISDKSRHFA